MAAIPPTKNHKLLINEFIRYAQQHLTTVSGIVNTISTYPPIGTPGPGIANWSGYSVQTGVSDLNEVERNAEAIQLDQEEYPVNQKIYEDEFPSEKEAMENNSDTTREEAFNNITQFKIEVGSLDVITDPQPEPKTPEPTPPSEPTKDEVPKKIGAVGKGDAALFKLCGNGIWPALGTAPNFEVRSTEEGNCNRYWYKVNKDYMIKNCTEIMFPTIDGDKKIMVHKNLAAIVKPAIVKIKEAGLEKYILNCGGGLAVRNVTCGSRLSNHSWGTAIDMNTSKYPYGQSFGKDGIYVKGKKKRDFDDFDIGFLKVANIFQSVGMTWLKNNDPMHVSIYE